MYKERDFMDRRELLTGNAINYLLNKYRDDMKQKEIDRRNDLKALYSAFTFCNKGVK